MSDDVTTILDPILRPHDQISGYGLVKRRGRGGVAEVWEADSPAGYRVALKLVHLSTGLRAGELRALMITRSIRHPSLLELFGTWQVENVLIICMELADLSLADRLLEVNVQGLRGVPRSELLGYLGSVADAIDYLNDYKHSVAGRDGVGVQHRDLKPQNILLVGGQAKVADFGLARVMEQAVVSHTGPCTLPYAAPEYFGGKTSRQSDQYALAVTYCQLRGGWMPFQGSAAQIMFGHLHNEPDLTGLPTPERPILARALSKRPEDRWPDCRTFIDALQALESDQGCPVPDCLPREPRDIASEQADEDDSPVGFGLSLDSAVSDFITVNTGDLESTDFQGRHAELAPLLPEAESRLDRPSESARVPRRGPIDKRPAGDDISSGMTGLRPKFARIKQVAALTALGLVTWACGVWPLTARSHLRSPERDGTAARTAPRDPGLRIASSTGTSVASVKPQETAADTPVSPPDEPARDAGTPEAPDMAAPAPETVVRTANAPGNAPESLAASAESNEPVPGPAFLSRQPRATAPEALELTGPVALALDPESLTSSRPRAAVASLEHPERNPTPTTPPPSSSDWVNLEDKSPGDAPTGRTSDGDPGLTLPVAISVRAGETTKLTVGVVRGAPSMPVHLDFRGLPRGITVGDPTIPAGTDQADVILSASAKTLPGTAKVVVVAVAGGSKRDEAAIQITILPSPAGLACERGRGHLSRGAYAQAIIAFTESIRLEPDSFEAYFDRGVAYYLEGRCREALADYTIAIRSEPGSADARLARARAHRDLGEYRLALVDYTEAIRLRPDAKAYVARGCLQHEIGAYDQALADFELALRLRPDDLVAHYRRGVTRYVMGDSEGAIPDFTEVIRHDPKHASAYHFRSDAYARLGEFAKAGADHDTFVRLTHPSDKGKGILK